MVVESGGFMIMFGQNLIAAYSASHLIRWHATSSSTHETWHVIEATAPCKMGLRTKYEVKHKTGNSLYVEPVWTTKHIWGRGPDSSVSTVNKPRDEGSSLRRSISVRGKRRWVSSKLQRFETSSRVHSATSGILLRVRKARAWRWPHVSVYSQG
jgi:hypothetical protein